MSSPSRPRWVVNVASIGMIVVTLALLLGLAAISGSLDPGELAERFGDAV